MTEFLEHGTDVREAVKIIIRKDDWIPSRPWHADLEFADGHVWRGWQQFFRSKKSLIENAKAACECADVEVEIVG